MPLMVCRRRLEPGDFDAWKLRFEQGAPARKAAGSRGVRRFRGIEDPLELMVIFDWDTIENAKAFFQMKVTENPKLTEARLTAPGPKLDSVFMEEMEPLPS